MGRPIVRVGASFLPRFKSLVWGLWALSRAVVYGPPPETGYIAQIETLTPIPMWSLWLVASILLVAGSLPTEWVGGRAREWLRWCRVVGIHATAVLTSIWLTASLLHFDLSKASTNALLVALAMISAYTISRDRVERGDAQNVN